MKPKVDEEDADDPPAEDDAAPVPQIKLGPNGEIILDEKSLVSICSHHHTFGSSTVIKSNIKYSVCPLCLIVRLSYHFCLEMIAFSYKIVCFYVLFVL